MRPTPNRRKLITLLVLVAMVASVGCGSVTKTAYNGLVGLKAAYIVTKEARTEYCHPKPDPRPAICADSYAPLLAAYQTIISGSDLLEAYAVTASADLKTKLEALVPVAAAETLEILKLNFGAAKTVIAVPVK